MGKNYVDILKEIQKSTLLKTEWEEREFYREIVRKLFIKKMGYESFDSSMKESGNTFQKNELLILGSVEEKWERGFSALIKHCKGSGCKWGILIHPQGMWLVNLDIITRTESSFTNSQIVLEIIYGMNTDQKYFGYFSAENTLGVKRNACFFRDIIDYKNNLYKGKEKSWPAYGSALKRFFNYYVENKGDYGNEENIYDSIQYAYFVEFIKKGTTCRSLKSARNSYFYIKDFMLARSDKGEFNDPERIKKSFPEFLPKYEMQNIMCVDKLKVALKFLEKNRNGLRNKTILLFFLAYGMERRKLCALKWKNIHFDSRRLEMNKKEYPIPDHLMEMLISMKTQGTSGEYVFCNSDGEALGEGAINTILSSIARADVKDGFYSQLTPANIRRCLAKFLLEHDYPLQKILYLMDIEGYKLSSYISGEDIEKTFWSESEEPVTCPTGRHPMGDFLEKLRYTA